MMTKKKPNFIFILADDLGYADLGCYGGREPVSPNLDRMAKEGLKFTNCYSNSPVCSPTRFALMTGRYQYHFRGAADEPLHGPNAIRSTHGLPPSQQTIPSVLKAQGYRTALVGKWHLGNEPHFEPLKSGYDEHFGLMSGGSTTSHIPPQTARKIFGTTVLPSKMRPILQINFRTVQSTSFSAVPKVKTRFSSACTIRLHIGPGKHARIGSLQKAW